MRLWTCDCCGQVVFFENTSCTRCGAILGFSAEALRLMTIESSDGDRWRAHGEHGGETLSRHCANRAQHEACNWLVSDDDPHAFCVACRLNRTIPDLGSGENEILWRRLELEKRRLIYGLLRLGLPVTPQAEDAAGLAFDFLADPDPRFGDTGRVLTGHAEGLITLNIAEADPVARERMRAGMAEPYRTIIGHFRHESGHYYWDRLVRDSQWLAPFRAMFGDERADYGKALQRHYAEGPPADWTERFVSAYAASHPWEDWAETWAHYLHILDTMETAHEFGLGVSPRVARDDALRAETIFDPYRQESFPDIVAHWLPLTYALNSLNRSMGHDHVYPFVLPPPVLDKLDLVHQVVRNRPG